MADHNDNGTGSKQEEGTAARVATLYGQRHDELRCSSYETVQRDEPDGQDGRWAVYDIGRGRRLRIRVAEGEEAPRVLVSRESYGSHGRHDQTIEGMQVTEVGDLTIPMEGLVQFVLRRISPVELARCFMLDPDVLEAVVESLIKKYGNMNVSDPQRRTLLRGLKERVHDESIDRLVGKLGDAERAFRERWHVWNEVDRLNNLLAALDVRYPEHWHEKVGERVRLSTMPLGLNNLFEDWSQMREYWRKAMLEKFPNLPNEEAPQENDDDAVV